MNQIARLLLMVIVLVGGARANDEAPMGARPSKPAEQRPGCFAESVRIPFHMQGTLPKTVTLQFTVTELGRIQDVRTADSVDSTLAAQLRAALARCAWTPATDARRGPVSARVEMRVRFEHGHVAPATEIATRADTSVPVVAR